MKDPDSAAHPSLPELSVQAGARVIRLPLTPGATNRHQSRSPQSSGKRPGLWYALYFPQLAVLSAGRQQQALEPLAAVVQHVSSTVSLHEQALVCEVRSSLKYFGGLDALHERLQPELLACLEELRLEQKLFYAACPTVTGSLLLARAGHNALVYRRENLRSVLGQLTIEALHLNKEQNRRLYNMGARHLRDIWRLPGDGLRKRFGSDLVNRLNKALGLAPEPTRNYLPPPAFATACDLPYELESLDRILPVADELLAQLCDFLRRRDLSTSHLEFLLVHENRAGSTVDLGLRQPSRCRSHLLSLLETHFGALTIPAPVVGVKLRVKQFDAHMGRSESLLTEQAPAAVEAGNNLDLFMEQLKARLGHQPVQSIDAVAEHCPEYACRRQDYEAATTTDNTDVPVSRNPRPFWLLSEPRPLTLNQGKLYHHRPLTLLSGPERIETRWWSGQDVHRDYYVAREGNGSRLWIFRERSGERRWYLHGIFA